MRNITTNITTKVYAKGYSRVYTLMNSPRKHTARKGLALLEYAMLAGVAVGGFILIDRFLITGSGGKKGFITELTEKIACQFRTKTTECT